MSSIGGTISALVGRIPATATVVAVALVGAGAIVIPVVTGGTGDTTVANIWASPSAGSGCARSSSPATFNSATDCSFSAAITAAQSGDVVGLVSGSFGSTSISGKNTGSKFSIVGADDHASTVNSMWLQNASNIRIQGLNFEGSLEFRMHSTITPSPHDIDVVDNLWDSVDDDRFMIGVSNTFSGRSVSNILIQDNTISNIPVPQTSGQNWTAWDTDSGDAEFDNGYAIYAIGGNGSITNWTIDGNLISNVINDGMQIASASNFTITNNVIESVAWNSRTTGGRHADPIHSQNLSGATVTNNILRHNDQPIQIQDGNEDWTMTNNLMFDVHGPCVGAGHFWGNATDDTGVTGMDIHDNTFWNCGIDDSGYASFLMRGGGDSNQFYDNILNRNIGVGASAWDNPLCVGGSSCQFTATTGGNYTSSSITGASPANFFTPNPSFPADSFSVGTANRNDPANWVPVGGSFTGKGYRP